MKIFQIKNYVILLYMLIPSGLLAQNKQIEKSSLALSKPDLPFKLNVNIVNGSISIFTRQGKEISIETETSRQLTELKSQEKNQNININSNINTNINVNSRKGNTNKNNVKLLRTFSSGNSFTIEQINTNTPINIRIGVPENHATVNLNISGNGDINVKSVKGELEVMANEGSITLLDINGSAIAATVNGHIRANFKTLSPNVPMAFSNLTGDIALSLPVNTKASLMVKSDNGQLSSDFSLSVGNRNQKPNNAKIIGTLKGNINGGGQEISITNLKGNISLRKSK